jgi:TyrR family helix-turn-helix protein
LERLKTQSRQDPDVIIASQAMKDIFEMAERIASVDATVLLLGETGVGKDVLARHIYLTGDRYDRGDFIKINCGAIPSELLESELFGYEGGAFTGASKSGKAGMFELANQGILFLDEIGEMPLSLQVKLLRVLKEMVKQGKFREDLFYRLHVVPIHIPPLRERRDDILPFVQSFLNQANYKYHIAKDFDRELREFFFYYDWPGNVREVSNLVERLVLTVPTKRVTYDDLPHEYRGGSATTKQTSSAPDVPPPRFETLKEATERAEREVLARAVKTYTSTYQIARALETSQATIVRKLRRYGLVIADINGDSKMNQT